MPVIAAHCAVLMAPNIERWRRGAALRAHGRGVGRARECRLGVPGQPSLAAADYVVHRDEHRPGPPDRSPRVRLRPGRRATCHGRTARTALRAQLRPGTPADLRPGPMPERQRRGPRLLRPRPEKEAPPPAPIPRPEADLL